MATQVALRPEDIQAIITGLATHPEALQAISQLMRTSSNLPGHPSPQEMDNSAGGSGNTPAEQQETSESEPDAARELLPAPYKQEGAPIS